MRSALAPAVTAVLLVGLETLAYLKGGPFSWVAARLWGLMGLGFLVLAAREILKSVEGALRERSVVSLVMVVLVIFAALWGIGGVDRVQLQHEATIEVAWGLKALEDSSWSYTGNGHIGYPGRQFLIVAAPSLVLGRNFVALRLGFALVFVLGVLLFWSGARAAWGDRPRGRAAAALAAISVIAFPYAVKHLHWYEQTTLPLAFTLAAVGWLMITLRRPSDLNWIGMAWIGALLGTSYTPALGAWLLLLVALVWLGGVAWRDGDHSAMVRPLAVAVVVAGFGDLSFLTRVDLIREHGDVLRPDAFEPLVEAFSIFVLGSPTAFIPVVLALPVLAVLVLGLVGRLGVPGLAISWWTLGIVAASIGFTGYMVRRPDFEMHRAQVLIPPLLFFVGWSILQLKALGSTSRVARIGFGLVGLLIIGQALWTVASSYRSYRPTLHEMAYLELFDRAKEHGVTGEDPVALLILTQRGEFLNSRDFLRYFFPRHTTVTTIQEVAGLDRDVDLLFVIADPEVDLTHLPTWIDSGSWTTLGRVNPNDSRNILVWAGPLPPV